MPTTLVLVLLCGLAQDPPSQRPRFVASSDHPSDADSLATLFRRHDAGAGPKATLWDAWLVAPSLWPAGADADARRAQWRDALLSRDLDESGYVATHQHPSIAHPRGWPFPFWQQGKGVGWHFSFHDTVGPGWRPDPTTDLAGFTLSGAENRGLEEKGFRIELTGADATIDSPPIDLDPIDAPFLQLRIEAPADVHLAPAIEWLRDGEKEFNPARRVTFSIEPGAMRHVAIEMRRRDGSGRIKKLRIALGNREARSSVVLQAFFTQYDTRHDVNDADFLIGSGDYFAWTGDREFLARNLDRMRRALEYLLTEQGVLKEHVVRCSWIGHDGRSGIVPGKDGKQVRSGVGIGANYWDLLPFGWDDLYATNYAHAALLRMAEVEDAVGAHPEWKLEAPRRSAAELRTLASAVAREADARFWNASTGRFAGCIDVDGVAHDYGFTFVNLEAIRFGVASDEHARSILDWLDGVRVVDGDTSQKGDIYAFRFGPRATTKRNVDWYGWFWSGPETIPFGGQVQDGGAVLGFAYFDLMARLRVRGADDAYDRFAEILGWSDDVRKAGGYREYYMAHPVSTLQGCGTAGGLGLDCEFFESALVAQFAIDGILGFRPRADLALELDPALPSRFEWFAVEGVRWRDLVLDVKATKEAVFLRTVEGPPEFDATIVLRGSPPRIVKLVRDSVVTLPYH